MKRKAQTITYILQFINISHWKSWFHFFFSLSQCTGSPNVGIMMSCGNYLLLQWKYQDSASVGLTILHFSTKLALLRILKQRLVALDFVPRLTARLIKQSAVSAGCRATDERTTEIKICSALNRKRWCTSNGLFRRWAKRKSTFDPPPDVEVKGNVRFDLEHAVLRWLEYAVVCAVVVSEQLAVQKPEQRRWWVTLKSCADCFQERWELFLEMEGEHQ